jgi:dolichol-phosphate mannosyltransferase
MKPVILIPTYNERENLPALISAIRESAPGAHVLLIDDNSPDGTAALAEEIAAGCDGAVSVLKRAAKDGFSRAYRDGIKHILKDDYDVVVMMDGDLSHDPKSLPVFFEQISDHDLVVGSRYLHGISVINWDLKRLILSKFATRYVQLVTALPFTDTTSGFCCWRREKLELIDWDRVISNGYLFTIEMKYRAHQHGLKITEVPIIFTERRLGKSKLNWAIILEAITGVIRLRFSRRNHPR